MIVGLVRPGFSSDYWNGFEFEYALFLAQQIAKGPTSALIDLDFNRQLTAADDAKSAPPKAKNFVHNGVPQSRERLLASSQIWEIYTSNTLVVDLKLRCEEDLECLDQWVDAVCSLNRIAKNTTSCPCGMLHHSKKVYAVLSTEMEHREHFEQKIRAILKRIGLTQTTFFFRSFRASDQSPIISNVQIPKQLSY